MSPSQSTPAMPATPSHPSSPDSKPHRGISRKVWIVPVAIVLLLTATCAVYPTPEKLQGDMWRLRSDVLDALRSNDRQRASEALAEWRKRCGQVTWSTLLHAHRWDAEERSRQSQLAEHLGALQAAVDTGDKSDQLQSLALAVFESHRQSASDGYLVLDALPAAAGSVPACHAGHKHALVEVTEGLPAPTLSMEVLPDPKVGWNLKLSTTNFRFAPEHASTAPQSGEGHGHLYVDGKKIARLYSEWYYLGDLDPGEHFIHVTLNSNDHNDLAKDGRRIETMTTIQVPDTRLTAIFGGSSSAVNSQQ